MKRVKIGIVILNYLNVQDTIECVNSALTIRQAGLEIIVIDNGSPNQSFEKLKKKWKSNPRVHVIGNMENLGFARGNNTGISYARETLGCDYVFCVNNDIVFSDPTIIRKLLSADDGNTAVIGPRIIGRDGLNQNPVKTGITYRKIARDLFFSTIFSFIDIETLRRLPGISMYLNRKKRKNTSIAPEHSGEIILHGSAMLFTPLFFRYFKGLYPGTFLYYEENILAVLLRNNRLRVTYTATTEVYHKEDMSSTLSFGNKSRTKSRYQRSSILKCLALKLFRTKRA